MQGKNGFTSIKKLNFACYKTSEIDLHNVGYRDQD